MKYSIKNNNLNELIGLAKKGDMEALEEIIKRQQKTVFATLYYLNAKPDEIMDITQEILFKVAKNIKKLKNPRTFKSWLNQIIINQFYDTLRKKQKSVKKVCLDNQDEDKPNFEAPDFASNPYQKAVDKELEFAIKNSIHKLPDPFKAAIIMRELQGLSYEEIAQATNSNIGTVKSRIARARLKLQEYLKPYLS